jgi:hypothetical protein
MTASRLIFADLRPFVHTRPHGANISLAPPNRDRTPENAPRASEVALQRVSVFDPRRLRTKAPLRPSGGRARGPSHRDGRV